MDAVVQVAHPQDPLALSKVSVSLSDEVKRAKKSLFENMQNSNKCLTSSNRCLTSSNKKLVGTSALLVVTGALLVVTRS